MEPQVYTLPFEEYPKFEDFLNSPEAQKPEYQGSHRYRVNVGQDDAHIVVVSRRPLTKDQVIELLAENNILPYSEPTMERIN